MTKKMLAVVKEKEGGGQEATKIKEVPIPEPPQGYVRIKVKATSICGTDRHIYNGDPSMDKMLSFPLIYGHEFCGYIDAFGHHTQKRNLKEGDYVTAEMHVSCGYCEACLRGDRHICSNLKILGVHADGCFAQYCSIPVDNIISLPSTIPAEVASFMDALGNAVHMVQDIVLAGKNVLILGYGPIGAMALCITQFLKARHTYVTEIHPKSLQRAMRWISRRGLTEKVTLLDASSPEEKLKEAIFQRCPQGVDVVLETSGAPSALNLGLDVAKPGGEVILLGIPQKEQVMIESYNQNIIFKGLTLKGILGRRVFSTWQTMIHWLMAGLDVKDLTDVTVEGLEKFHEGMERFNQHEALKVVFLP